MLAFEKTVVYKGQEFNTKLVDTAGQVCKKKSVMVAVKFLYGL